MASEWAEIIDAALDRAIDTVATAELEHATVLRQGEDFVLVLNDGRMALISVRAAHVQVIA